MRIFIILTLLSKLSIAYPQDSITSKSEFADAFFKTYCTELYKIATRPNVDFDSYCSSNNKIDFISELPTLIHEEYHLFNFDLPIKTDSSRLFRKYYFNDTIFIVRKTPVFVSSEVSQIVQQRIRDGVFRYKTYIAGKNEAAKTQDSQVNGIYGIMEEFAAYCNGLKVYVNSYSYLKSNYSFKETDVWIRYLTTGASSVLYAYYEFKLFISWYIQLAKAKYPKIYLAIQSNKTFWNFYKAVDKQFVKLLRQYWINRDEVDGQIKSAVVQKDNFIFNKDDPMNGYGLPDKQLLFTKKLLIERRNLGLGLGIRPIVRHSIIGIVQ